MGIDIYKALDTTSGSAIIPEQLDPEIQELADKKAPLRKVFKRTPWGSDVFSWNARTALGASNFYVQSDGFSENESTLARRTISLKMVKAEGGVSGLVQATSANFVNALQLEIEGATESLAQTIENAYINGDEAGSVNNREFDGLTNLISSTVDASGASIGFDVLNTAIYEIEQAGGKPDLIVLAGRDKAEIDDAMQTLVKVNWTSVETPFGVRLPKYKDIPVISSQFVSTDLDYGTTTTGDYSEAFVLDTSTIVIPEAKPISYEEVSQDRDGSFFRLNSYLALVIKAAERQRKIINIGKV